MATETETKMLDRDEAIARIRKALKARTGMAWSVTGGRGTAWGWITITSPKARRVDGQGNPCATDYGYMTPADCALLAATLGLSRPSHCQGESIPSGSDYREEYVDRAEGRTPTKLGKQYWD